MRRARFQMLLFMALTMTLIAGGWSCNATEADTRSLALETAAAHTYTFEARMTGYYGVGGAIDGIRNPTLQVEEGQEVTIKMINGESMAHDIVLEKHDVRSEILIKSGESTTITFVARSTDTYFCSIPGHIEAGMIGTLEVIAKERNPNRS
ncbi:MAG: cupredoxin domain-containing protein [Bradymonadaceae bacterium]